MLKLTTPIGIISRDEFIRPIPDEAKYNAGYYICDILVSKDEALKNSKFKTLIQECKDLLKLKGSKLKKPSDVKNFFITDIDTLSDEELSYLPEEFQSNAYRIRAKQYKEILGRPAEVALVLNTKTGNTFDLVERGEEYDYFKKGTKARMVISPWYSNKHGETLGANLLTVQFIAHTDIEFPSGDIDNVSLLDDLEDINEAPTQTEIKASRPPSTDADEDDLF